MKTIKIPNVMKFKINDYEHNEIEIDSIEQLESLKPIRLYDILETYNDKTRKWAYDNQYQPDKKEIIEHVKKLGLN